MVSLLKQKKTFLSVKSKNSIKSGSTANLISSSWFTQWKKAVGIENDGKSDDSIQVGPIDNKSLLLNGKLKPTLTEKYDFVILSRPLWRLLNNWYPGGPEIEVKIVDHPEKHVPVPILYEMTFDVFYQKQNVNVKANRYEQVNDIKLRACEKFDVNPKNFLICDFWNHNRLPAIPDQSYIYNLQLVDTQELLLQNKDQERKIKSTKRVTRTNSSMTIGLFPFGSMHAITNAHVGLTNLGNTCYFNSAVQALSHTPLLATFFINANWREKINRENPLSTEGHLANSLAQIVNDMWTKPDKVINPKRLFDTIVQYAPRFGDFKQHDSHELMMFLLDGIHEDLNRVKRGAYIEGIECDENSQETAAEAAWKRYKLINDSIIVDLFHGQLMTGMECPVCKTHTYVFDPYLCVTLPLPTERLKYIQYMFIPYDLRKKRSILKIYSVPSSEAEYVLNDAVNRFSLEKQSCIVMYRDKLVSGGLKLVRSLPKVEYFAFEIPDISKFYTIAFLEVEHEKKKDFHTVIDGPILITIPGNFKSQARAVKYKLNNICEERFNYLWEPSEYPMNDNCRMKDLKISSSISDKLMSQLKEESRRFFAQLVPHDRTIFKTTKIPQFSSTYVRIILNPLLSRTKKGFQWPAVLPLNREGNVLSNMDISLQKCFECFSYPDKLDKLNEWFCPKCRKLVRAKAKLDIWSVPDNLILQIKRFVARDYSCKKLFSKIDIPEVIDMAPYIIGPQNKEDLKYQLHSVIHHIGTMDSGHYMATAYSEKEGKWFTYNDESVYETPKKGSNSENAYILFYHRIQK